MISTGASVAALHDVEDVGQPGAVLAYRCHTCGSAAWVEFPTRAHQQAIRDWLHRHPSLLRGVPGQRIPGERTASEEGPFEQQRDLTG